MAKNKQFLVIDENRKLFNVIECEINKLEGEKINDKQGS